ncbi:MAG TPA: glycogen synthase GlgA [Candidatus Binataceae bacterium]|nr:glycogen synthase GlgA [Candidatus Binataceae bacterium]
MKVAIVAAEITPWAKAGGLADVIGALPAALKQCGAEPAVILPGYRAILDALKPAPVAENLSVPVGVSHQRFDLLRAETHDGVPLYLINHPGCFDRAGVYGERGADYPDNLHRYVMFGRAAALAAARFIRPDVLHAHDWHAAVAPIVARADPALREALGATLTVFTVHNLAFQGIFEAADFGLLNLDRSYFSVECLEFWGRVNLVKGAIVLADGASTVSPTYAHEVSSDPELGFGLEGVLRHKGSRFVGILNGADYTEWDPAIDPMIAAKYTPARREGKAVCRRALRKLAGLRDRDDVPILGMVTRMTPQKGINLIGEALDAMMALDVQFVMLASGDPALEKLFKSAEERFPGQLHVRLAFDNAFAHQIQAGSDIFLMPSRFEPCGLTQMYALKYGTAPLVRATGGLKDTVSDFDPQQGAGNGFMFSDYRASAMVDAMARARRLFADRVAWRRLMDNCFAADFSWSVSARHYLRWFDDLRRTRGV